MNLDGKVIMLIVGADCKEFREVVSENNHYVALYFKDEQIYYIDPTGEYISENLKHVIQSSHTNLGMSKINSSSTALQYTNKSIIKEENYCASGLLIPLVLHTHERS